jgi:hypothetical protein
MRAARWQRSADGKPQRLLTRSSNSDGYRCRSNGCGSPKLPSKEPRLWHDRAAHPNDPQPNPWVVSMRRFKFCDPPIPLPKLYVMAINKLPGFFLAASSSAQMMLFACRTSPRDPASSLGKFVGVFRKPATTPGIRLQEVSIHGHPPLNDTSFLHCSVRLGDRLRKTSLGCG